jgi:hypothetical protein
MWADRYLKNALQLKFWNVEVAHVLPESLKMGVSSNKHCNSVGEFPLTKLIDTYIFKKEVYTLKNLFHKHY